MRIIFAGTPDFALPTLNALSASSHSIPAVITQPDRPKGRGKKAVFTPVKTAAIASGIPVLQPERISDILDQIRALRPDCLAVAAYGQMIPPELLSLPEYGAINIHASLLPKYRGAAPINWAIINGEETTGITIMQMDKGLDTGDILAQAEIPIYDYDTAGTLHDRLSQQGAQLLVQTLAEIKQGRIIPQVQNEKLVSYAPRLKKQDGLIDWQDRALDIQRRIRGVNPRPGAYTYLEGKRIKLFEAEAADGQNSISARAGEILQDNPHMIVATGDGFLKIKLLQPENRKKMQVGQYIAGLRQSLIGKVFT